MPDGAGHPGENDDFRPPLPPEDRIWRHPSELRDAPPPPEVVDRGDARRARGGVGVIALLTFGSIAVFATVVLLARTLEVDGGDGDVAARLAVSTSTPSTVMAASVLLGMDGRDTPEGVLVVECRAGGPARAAGLRAGDLVVGLGGVSVVRMDQLSRLLAHRGPQADSIDVRVRRSDAELTVAVRVGSS